MLNFRLYVMVIYLKQASPKAANIRNCWCRERSERNLRFHSKIIKTSSKRANDSFYMNVLPMHKYAL